MRTVLLAQVRAHAGRLVASTLAVVIAVGFVVGTLVLNETSRSTVLAAVGAQYVGAAAVVTSDDGSSLADDVAPLAALGSVAAVAPSWETSVQANVPGRTGSQYLLVDAVAEDPALRWQHLQAGRLPDRPGEVAVSERARAELGDVLTLSTYDEQGQATTSSATVTGIVDLGGDPAVGPLRPRLRRAGAAARLGFRRAERGARRRCGGRLPRTGAPGRGHGDRKGRGHRADR